MSPPAEFAHAFAGLGEATIPGDGGDFSQAGRRRRHAFHRAADPPALAIGGGGTDAFGRAGEVEASLRRVATDVRGPVAEDCGHFAPEEDPAFTARAILDRIARSP